MSATESRRNDTPTPGEDPTTVMQGASTAIVRIVVLSVAIAGYYAVVSASGRGDAADADIGAGLAGFVGLALLSLGWAFIDGRAGGIRSVMVSWSVVAATVAVGWRIVVAVVEADSSASVAEILLADLSLTFFLLGLVLVPALVGSLAGEASRRRRLA